MLRRDGLIEGQLSPWFDSEWVSRVARSIKFINMNGLMDDPMKVYKDRQVMNLWSEQEKETFREK